MLRQKALTLVELMIALLITAVVIAAVLGVYSAVVKHGRATVEQGHLENELQRVVRTLARDVRRAGYWSGAATSATNPYMQAGTDITVNGSNDCILLTYDHNDDGTLPAVSSGTDDERYGFRLSGGAIQFRQNSAAFDCAAAANAWTNLTNPNIITVTTFSVTLNEDAVSSMIVRSVAVSITGQLVSDSSITKTVTQTIKVQNDKYSP